jgi:hypothetical protein
VATLDFCRLGGARALTVNPNLYCYLLVFSERSADPISFGFFYFYLTVMHY